MERLSLHINHLMRTHDCVIVPGIGAFLALMRPARFDADDLVVYPAVREICFNASIAHNDGLLASSVARREGIPYPEAVKAIEEETGEMRRALRERPVEVGKLGSLSLTTEGHLRFSPRSPEEEWRELGFGPVALGAPASEPLEEASAEKPQFKARKQGYWYIPVPKTATKVAASLILAVAVALSFLLPPTAEKPLPDKASVVPVCRVEIPTREDVAEKPAAEAEMTTRPEPQAKAYLIVATFRSEAQARRFIDSNPDGGLELVPGGSVFRVSAAKAASAAELRSTLNSREFQTRYSEAWIWEAPESR